METYYIKLSQLLSESISISPGGGIDIYAKYDKDVAGGEAGAIYFQVDAVQSDQYDWDTTVTMDGSPLPYNDKHNYFFNYYYVERDLPITHYFTWDGKWWDGVNEHSAYGQFTIILQNDVNCTVSYDANGGTNAPKSSTVLFGTIVYIDMTPPKMNGYTFMGWSTNKDATEPEYPETSDIYLLVKSNITLYAIWRPLRYVFDGNTFRSVIGTKVFNGSEFKDVIDVKTK